MAPMRKVYQQELSEIQDRLVEVSRLVVDAMTRASRALGAAELDSAETVITDEALIRQLTQEFDLRVVDIMARQAPVAKDLRLMVASLRMSASLERMADLAKHVSVLARHRHPEVVGEGLGLAGALADEGRVATQMARVVVELLRTFELELVERLESLDAGLDATHADVVKAVRAGQGQVADSVDVAQASRLCERFGDHAVKVGQQVRFLLTGGLP